MIPPIALMGMALSPSSDHWVRPVNEPDRLPCRDYFLIPARVQMSIRRTAPNEMIDVLLLIQVEVGLNKFRHAH
jgi:hypothetical protein